MYKFLVFLATLFLSTGCVFADGLTKVIKNLDINPGSVAVSVKDVRTGTEVYSLNKNTPMTPASTLKIVTLAASIDTLTPDYKFSTKLYKSTNNDLYVKLGADPFLKSSDLKTLFGAAYDKKIFEPKKIYIDDSIFNSREWGEGWQWDDELNPLMPKFSAYNIDENLLSVDVNPVLENSAPFISIKPYYPLNIMNFVNCCENSQNYKLTFEKGDLAIPNTILAYGAVQKPQTVKLPVPNPRVYFLLRLDEAVREHKILYSGHFPVKKLPSKDVYLVKEINHEFLDAINSILQKSNNMQAETVFKLAGAKAANDTGCLQNSLNMLHSFLDRLGLKYEDVKIVDGSGVSKNNIVNADFMTDFLVNLSNNENFEVISDALPTPGEGTLKNRMLYFKDFLKAKTGTLSDTSAIAGYITTRKGKTYAFDIMIKDPKTTDNAKKNVEEQILRYIYMN